MVVDRLPRLGKRERANLSAVVYLQVCGFCLERFPLPLGVWDGLLYFIVAPPEPSINYFPCISSCQATHWM